jgi:hypothetical protein
MTTKRSVMNSEHNVDIERLPGTVSALFRDSKEADGALAELHLRGFLPESINVSVNAWSREAGEERETAEHRAVVFDPAIPPDEPMAGGRIMGIGEEHSLDEADIAQAADRRNGPIMDSTVRLTVRLGEHNKDMVRTILEEHGGEVDA